MLLVLIRSASAALLMSTLNICFREEVNNTLDMTHSQRYACYHIFTMIYKENGADSVIKKKKTNNTFRHVLINKKVH